MTPHPNKDGREPLTREKIVEKAIELIDAEGAEHLTMRRLGEALGVEAMAMYHYFPGKDAILDDVAARILAETVPEGPGLHEDWKVRMLSGPAAAGRALEAHPKAGWLFFGRHSSTAISAQMLETPLAILHAAGFRGRELVDAAHAIFALAGGWYMLTSGEGGSWGGPSETEIATIASTDAEVASLAASNAASLRDWSHGFDCGMMALLEGLEARLKTKEGPRHMDMREVRDALRTQLRTRGYDVASDSHGLRIEIYIMGDGDLARALFEFKATAAEAVDSMYQGSWVEGLPPRFAVMPSSESGSADVEMLEQVRVIPLHCTVSGDRVEFPGLDALLAKHLPR